MWKPGMCSALILLASIGMAHGQSWNVVSTVTSTIPSSESVELSCVFDNAWSAATHPIDYPGTDAHWSPMVVAAHSTDYEMWSRNSFASDGVVSVAETGSTSTLFGEMDTAGDAVLDRASGSVIFVSNTPSTTIEPLELDSDHSYLSTIAMIAPSPDWFSGFYNWNAIDTSTDTWYESFVIETFPWDAGSDSGVTYDAPNDASNPVEPIFQLTANTVPTSTGVFLSPDGTTVLPVATWTCSVLSAETSAPTSSPVDPTPAPIDSTPAPIDPTPSPVDPTPAPVDTTPAPVDSRPTPAPVDSTPPPVDPTPSPLIPTVPPTPAPVTLPDPPSKVAPATIVTTQITPKDFDGCMGVNATTDSLLIATCSAPPEPRSKLFELDGGINRIRPATNLNKCLQAGSDGTPMDGTPVIISDCDSSNPYQRFTFDKLNGGPIKLAFIPEYCLSFTTDDPVLDEEPLIMLKCADVPFLSNGWEVKN